MDRILLLVTVTIIATTAAKAQSVTYNHDSPKQNQVTVMETGTGALSPDLYYSILHNKYKKSAAVKNKLSFRTLAGVNLYNQTDEAEAIDSALVSRAKIEALNVADRQADIAWVAEGDKVNGQMVRFKRNIDRILPVGGTPEDKDRWTEYYHIYQCAIDATKDAYMPNAQRKKEYLRIYEDITRQNEILVGYLAKRQNTTITSTLLNATADRTLDKESIVRDAVNRWHESRFAVRGPQSGNNTGGNGDGDETVNKGTEKQKRMADGNILSDFGINILEEEIDDVIFQTNEFLTDATFTGSQGPFWWILQMCMALAALFAIVMAAGMAYKMMVKHEPLDVLKLFRPLAVSIILCWWYPPADTGMAGSGSSWCFLDFLSYIPNCIGSYTHDLYEAEATQIADKFEEVQQLIHVRDTMYQSLQAQADVAHTGTSDPNLVEATMEQTGVDEVTKMEKDAAELWFTSLTAGVIVGIDKIIMLIALIVYRIGWWATIYCQQILLGMLTIFGPIQWAFSLLPKWEGAWAKWLIRYLTVHFYGAMLYFVGFYVLLLFDIVLCIQVENLTAITASEQTMAAYLQNSFFSAGYLMAASIVALKCLNLVPDLAAWMIPEGDTAFSTRNFGEGVAQQAKMTATGGIGSMMR